MKRANLVLDEKLLDEALRVSGERTYSRAVARVLTEFVLKVRTDEIVTCLPVLHRDRDFDLVARVSSLELRLVGAAPPRR